MLFSKELSYLALERDSEFLKKKNFSAHNLPLFACFNFIVKYTSLLEYNLNKCLLQSFNEAHIAYYSRFLHLRVTVLLWCKLIFNKKSAAQFFLKIQVPP